MNPDLLTKSGDTDRVEEGVMGDDGDIGVFEIFGEDLKSEKQKKNQN